MSLSPTLILVILNIGASLYAWNNQDVYRKWMMTPYKVKRENQYYRFITSGFIHGDWMHLIFNMIALYSFGRNLEYYLAAYVGASYPLYYVAMYLTALILSEIPTYLKHKNNAGYNSLGASGAVSAVIFACVIIHPLSDLYLFFIPMKGFIFGAIYLVYSYMSSKKGVDGINHDAHFYGAVFGIVFIVLLNPSVVPSFFEQISQWNLFQ
jgi:membrane associated rhomboid family serine protease